MRAYRRKRLFASYNYVSADKTGFGRVDLYFNRKHALSPSDLDQLIKLIERKHNISGVIIIDYKFM